MPKEIIINKKSILVTGAAGFIGARLVHRLLKGLSSAIIIGIDNLNDYYEVSLKKKRVALLSEESNLSKSQFFFRQGDIADKHIVEEILTEISPSIVVNLAAQAGVRYSIESPDVYVNSNIIGFYNILEACRHSYDNNKSGVQHLIYASSSSVYGGNIKVPFSEGDSVDHPVSLYAATKKSNELLAHSYSKLYNIPCTGLRFFTVYGPAGRPDMAYFSFAEKLRKGEKIKIFNHGNCMRDFTYIDDIIEGIIKVMQNPPERKEGSDGLPIPPYAIYNIGNGHPENLMDFVYILAEELMRVGTLSPDFDIKAHIDLVPMQAGDVPITYADTSKFQHDFDFKPSTDLRTGLRKFAEWYKGYYSEG